MELLLEGLNKRTYRKRRDLERVTLPMQNHTDLLHQSPEFCS